MKKLNTSDEINMLLHAPAASAALGAAITTGLLWMLAERPMTGEEVVQALNIPGKRGHYWLQYLQSFGILETVQQGYITSSAVQTAILDTYSRESWQHLVIDEASKDSLNQKIMSIECEPARRGRVNSPVCSSRFTKTWQTWSPNSWI
jgi:hypothetical protein